MLHPLIKYLTNVWLHPCIWNVFLSQPCMNGLAPSLSVSSLKGNDCELLDKNGNQKSGMPHLHMLIKGGLIVVCHSTLSHMFSLKKFHMY